jgi:hypothetical protein
MRRLGAKSITALVVADRRIAWQILALNTEKAHNLKERSLEVIRIYRGLVDEDATRSELPFNPTVYSVEEFKSKLSSGNHFLTAVLKSQKEFLLGDEDELRKVGGVRLAKAGADQPQVRSRIFWELWIIALRIQRSKLFRPTFDLSLLSTPRSASRQQRFAPAVFAPLPKEVTTSKQSNLWNLS